MIGLYVTANLLLDPWDDLEIPPHGAIARVGLLPDGTTDGQPTVMVDVVLTDGTHLLGETSWRLFSAAYHALADAGQRLTGDPS